MTTTPEPNGIERIGEVVSIFQRGTRWHANFQHEGKQQRKSLDTSSKKEARRRALLLEAEIINHRYQPDQRPLEVEAAVKPYLDFLRAEGRAARTLGKYARVFERVVELAQKLKRSSLLGIDLAFIDAYRQWRVDASCGHKTIYTETVVVRQLINFSLSRKLIHTDPLAGLKIPRPKPTPQPCWSPDEVARILAASQPPQKNAYTVLAETGLRIGELKWLTWPDVDFERNVLRIRPKEGWKPKTGDQRAVPMTATLRTLLETLPRRGTWVLTAADGTSQISDRRLLQTLKGLLKQLDLPGHLHTFRHAFISHALTAGAPEAVVRSWVGHVDQEIMQLYTHIADAASQSAMRKLSEARSPTSSGKDAQE